jgi:hypothetical protein
VTNGNLIIRIAEDFTKTPGPRNQAEGDFSGEAFLGKLLEVKFVEALNSRQRLVIVLDGVEGYATSFLEAAFGGLARKYAANDILKTLEFKSDEEPYLIEEIQEYIREARAK